MRNRPSKRALRSFDRINVDPLVIACRIGKQIDLRLGDGHPVRHSNFSACAGAQFGIRVESFHACNLESMAPAVSRPRDKGCPLSLMHPISL